MTLEKAPASRFSAPNQEGAAEDSSDAMAILESLGSTLLAKRDEAMNWRQQSGIEDDWQEDVEFYDARDRANPEGESNVGKPVSPDGGAINQPVATGRSSVFIPITRAYVDAAAARVADMLLPNDDAPWQVKPTPRPEMSVMAEQGNAMMPVAATTAGMSGAGPMPGMPMQNPGPASSAQPAGMGGKLGVPAASPTPPTQTLGISTVRESAMSPEEKAAERANKVIEDWLIECQWHAEARKAIEDAAQIGTGILKGPFPVLQKATVFKKDEATGQYTLQEVSKVVPVTKRVHPRNFWTDPAGGEDHQAGSYTWELDNISSRELRRLLDDETYIRENVLRALREGPGAKSGKDTPDDGTINLNVGATFPMWFFYGDIDKRTMLAAGVPEDLLPEGEEDEVAMPAMVVMVNDHVVKVERTPLDAGGFPYDLFPWQRRPGIPWGKGVGRQIRTPQRMLNAAVRAEMDNGALTSGPMYALRKGWIVAIDGNDAVLTPRKGFYMTADAPPTAKLEDAISFTNIQAATESLERIIDRAMRFAEDATGLPMLMQGQQGESTTTATGMTILNNNGSTVLRRIARTFDDNITEPHIRRYYYWLMADEGNDDAKGDFQIDARGSTYLVDRDMQAQNLNMLFPMLVQHPDIHPGRLAEEVALANRLPIQRIFLTDAEKKIRDSQPPQKPEAIQIAEIREQGAMQRTQLQVQQKEAADMRTAKVAEGRLQADVERGIGELAAKLQLNDNDAKLQLAIELMRQVHTSQEGAVDRKHSRISDIEDRASDGAPTEPAGRAPAGAAFAQ